MNDDPKQSIPHEIFKAYDIRGVVDKTLTTAHVETIGHAIGSEARARQLTSIAVGRDGRLSG
ncbi:MAG TPA: phosphomannomutase/phosphoglucomutase, partial [Nitrosomonas sp.]|nr:phosphomannomutase/phosphoglucomutase [Nitrosomonas sp.]